MPSVETTYSQPVRFFTGDVPYTPTSLAKLTAAERPGYTSDDLPDGLLPGTIVIGWYRFDGELMEALLEGAGKLGHPIRFVSQEAFLDEVLFGIDWWGERPDLLNWQLQFHPGLQHAHDLHLSDEIFEWPSVIAHETSEANERTDEFRQETDLHALGYRITGLSRRQRWAVLSQNAVPQLGLQDVAYTIAMLVRLRKAQRGGRSRFSYAIAEWEHDLLELKGTYYTATAYRFAWPTTEP